MSGTELPALILAGCVLALSGLHARSAQAPAHLPQLDQLASSKSVFLDDPKFGKDPFFPISQRRKPAIVIAVNSGTPDPTLYAQLLGGISLRGISGRPGKKLAMLNNRTVGVGELTEVKFNNQPVRVRCLEIREKSVLLGVEGTTETKEVFLRLGM